MRDYMGKVMIGDMRDALGKGELWADESGRLQGRRSSDKAVVEYFGMLREL